MKITVDVDELKSVCGFDNVRVFTNSAGAGLPMDIGNNNVDPSIKVTPKLVQPDTDGNPKIVVDTSSMIPLDDTEDKLWL